MNIEKRREANRIRMRNCYKNNPETYKQRVLEWKRLNPEKRKQSCKRWREANLEHIKQHRKNNIEEVHKGAKRWRMAHPEYIRQSSKRQRAKLADAYVRGLMSSWRCSLKPKEWPQSLVELRRQLIKTRRLLHEIRC